MQNSNSEPPTRIQNYIHNHPKAFLLIISIIFIILAGIIILFIANLINPNNPESTQEAEAAPYIITENDYLIEYPTIQAFGIDTNFSANILFNLKEILISEEELASAPNQNPDNQKYTATISEESYKVLEFTDTKLIYSMDISLSDGRNYTLYLYIDSEYENEYAIIALDRTDNKDLQDYVVTYTKPTQEYYDSIAYPNKTFEVPEGTITDYSTNIPLISLPKSADDWINNLKLTEAKIINTIFPTNI